MNPIKERPILFSDPMVRAILLDRKTQTRRIIKPQPIWIADPHVPFKTPDADSKGIINCPHGQPGDRLWVREAWQALQTFGHGYELATPPAPGCEIRYRSTDETGWIPPLPWRPSIFMPRWASRIILEITSVRAERLQDISPHDALAEGVGHDSMGNPVADYQNLWSAINGPHSWDQNPYVWVITFRPHRITPTRPIE